MITLVEHVVGYMYKVQKNQLDISEFRAEFAAIRHGNYFQFFNLIGKEIDFIVTNECGPRGTNTKVYKDEVAVTALFKVGECLKDFYKRAHSAFGVINDIDLSDSDFCRAAYFELSIRVHSNNKMLPSEEVNFVDVINSLELSIQEKTILHKGRNFINYIKRPVKMKGQWIEELSAFNEAFELMQSKQLTIV